MGTAQYRSRFCTSCKSLCTVYEQGLACGCGPPWETEQMHVEDYPAVWVVCEVRIAYGDDLVADEPASASPEPARA